MPDLPAADGLGAQPRARRLAPQRIAAPLTKFSAAAPTGSPAGHARVLQTNYQPEPPIEPAPERGHFVRPSRKMSEILPYDSYEPDPEIAAQDRCFNLCPRPKGGDCPDCVEADAAGGAPAGPLCPDCPWEQDLRRVGRAPGEPDNAFVPRNFGPMHYCWEPTNLYHNPIYFEDFPLERYGHTRHFLIQPFFSAAKFGIQLFGLPYQMTLNPVCSRKYALGYYRPGEYAPYKYYQIPLNAEAALVEAGVISGAYFLFAPGVGP